MDLLQLLKMYHQKNKNDELSVSEKQKRYIKDVTKDVTKRYYELVNKVVTGIDQLDIDKNNLQWGYRDDNYDDIDVTLIHTPSERTHELKSCAKILIDDIPEEFDYKSTIFNLKFQIGSSIDRHYEYSPSSFDFIQSEISISPYVGIHDQHVNHKLEVFIAFYMKLPINKNIDLDY